MKNTPKSNTGRAKVTGSGANPRKTGAVVEMLRAFKFAQESGVALKGHALAVAVALADSMWPVAGRFEGDPGIQALMNRTKWAKDTVRKALAALESSGVIWRKRQSMRVDGKTRTAEDRWILDPTTVQARILARVGVALTMGRQGQPVALTGGASGLRPSPDTGGRQDYGVAPSGLRPSPPILPVPAYSSTSTRTNDQTTEGENGQEEGSVLQAESSPEGVELPGVVNQPSRLRRDAIGGSEDGRSNGGTPPSSATVPAPAQAVAPAAPVELLRAAGFTGKREFAPWLHGPNGRAAFAGLAERHGAAAVEGALRDMAQASPKTAAARRVKELLGLEAGRWLTAYTLATKPQNGFEGLSLLEAAVKQWKELKPAPRITTFEERLARDRIRAWELAAEFSDTPEERAAAAAKLAEARQSA